MSVTIASRSLSGTVRIPPSKSMAHRLLLCAALAEGDSVVGNIALSDDVKVTLNAVERLGRQVSIKDGTVKISGNLQRPNGLIDCNESGSSLRFLIPIVSALGGGEMTGKPRLGERPLNVYREVFASQGRSLGQGFPLTVPAGLSGGEIHVSGLVSSQFISGLMLAAPLMHRDMHIILTSTLESGAYVDMTIQAMRAFGIDVQTREENQEYIIKAGQAYQPREAEVEGDWSQSGFWLLAGLSSDSGIMITGLDLSSRQGDRVILDVLKRMNADLTAESGRLTIKASDLKPADVDIAQCPDLAPVISGLMALTDKPCVMSGCARLRIKESDRIASIVNALNNLGSHAVSVDNRIEITGSPVGGSIAAEGDHRIAMMAAALSAHCTQSVKIDDETVVNKSYPAFWDDFIYLGGTYEPNRR